MCSDNKCNKFDQNDYFFIFVLIFFVTSAVIICVIISINMDTVDPFEYDDIGPDAVCDLKVVYNDNYKDGHALYYLDLTIKDSDAHENDYLFNLFIVGNTVYHNKTDIQRLYHIEDALDMKKDIERFNVVHKSHHEKCDNKENECKEDLHCRKEQTCNPFGCHDSDQGQCVCNGELLVRDDGSYLDCNSIDGPTERKYREGYNFFVCQYHLDKPNTFQVGLEDYDGKKWLIQ